MRGWLQPPQGTTSRTVLAPVLREKLGKIPLRDSQDTNQKVRARSGSGIANASQVSWTLQIGRRQLRSTASELPSVIPENKVASVGDIEYLFFRFTVLSWKRCSLDGIEVCHKPGYSCSFLCEDRR